MRSATLRMGLYLVGGSQIGSPILEIQPTTLETDLARSSRIVTETRSGELSARREAGSNILTLLQPHAARDFDVATLAGMLDLSLEQQRFQDQKFEQILGQLENASAGSIPPVVWNSFEEELNDRINHFLRMLQLGELGTKDAERLLGVARYAARAIGEWRDLGPAHGRPSQLFRMLGMLRSIDAETRGFRDQSAKDLMHAFRETLTGISKTVQGAGLKNPAATFEIQAAVFSAMSDLTERGWNAATETISHLSHALDRNPEAFRRMIESSRRMEQVLTSRAYARAIWNALTAPMIDRIPFAGTLAAWFGGSRDHVDATPGGR